jgi:hypothetical protein
MFKKAILASALAGLTSTAFGLSLSLNPDESALDSHNINTATGVATVHSLEGLTGATSMTAANAGILVAGVYTVGDKITVTYTQPFAVGATAAASLDVQMPGQGGAASDTMTLSRDGGSAVAGLSEITYTIADIAYDAGGTSANSTAISATNAAIIYTDPTLTFAPCAAACTVKVNASGTRGGAVIDASTTTGGLQVGSVVAELSVTATTAFNGVVDVGALRKAFTGGATADQGVATLAVATTTAGKEMTSKAGAPNDGTAIAKANATLATSTVTVSGSFGFLDCVTGTAGIQLSGAPCTGTNVLGETGADFLTVVANNTSSALIFTDADASETVFSLDIDSQNTAVIPVQSIATSWVVTGTTAVGSNAFTKTIATALGGFTMNGSATSVYAVPYGPGVQQYIWLTNEGASAGTITATAFSTNGTAYPTTGEYDLGAIAATSHKAIAADLLAKLVADGMDATVSQRLQIALTVTLPQANVNVYAAYRTGDARLALETSAGKDRQALLATAAALAVVDTEIGVIDTEVGVIDTEVGVIDTEVGVIDTEIAVIDKLAEETCALNTLAYTGTGGLEATLATVAGGVTAKFDITAGVTQNCDPTD